MRSLLISVDKFDAFSAHAVEIIDIVDTLLATGWRIDLICSVAGGVLTSDITRLSASGFFSLITDKQGELATYYDAMWIYRGFFSEKMVDAIDEQRLAGPMIFRHFSDYNDLYIPYGVKLENQFASLTLGLSPRTNEFLLQTGVDSTQLQTLPWAVPASFIDYRSSRNVSKPERVLYIAPRISAEMYEIQQRAAASDIKFEWLDLSAQAQRIEPSWLAQYDVVVGNENHVPKALVLGIPVFLVNEGYVEGYLDEDNLARNEHDHFCGVTLRNNPDADEWIELLIDGYASTAKWARQQSKQLAERWSLPRALDAILGSPLNDKPRTLDEKSRYALTFYRKTLLAQQPTQYSFSRWLADRSLSDARREALLAFVKSYPEKGSIGIVVLDDGLDNRAYERTLNSIAGQSLAPVSVDSVKIGERWGEEVNTLLTIRDMDAVLVIPAGFMLLQDALLRFAEQRMHKQNAWLFYCDEMTRGENGEPNPALRPDVNIDLLRGTPYIGQVLLFSREIALQAGGLDPHYQHAPLIDLLWRFVEGQGAGALAHVPDVLVESPWLPSRWSESEAVRRDCEQSVLAHLQRLGIAATLEEGLAPAIKRVRYRWEATPLVSIIIPTRDRFALLKRCIESVMEKTRYQHYELLIVDNQSVEEDACQFLNDLAALGIDQVRILRYEAPFNFAEINNAAAQQARGDILLFLNNDCEIIDDDWLEAMLEHALRPEVGMVGARLEYHDGRVQHGGYLTGIQHGMAVVFDGAEGQSNGYQYYLKTPRNLAAVSASCMMVRKEVFVSLNGFTQEHYPLYFADVDLGLRAQQAGYLNVWTPYARVKHMGGATRLMGNKFHVQERPLLEDYATLRREWKQGLLAEPSYHPLMQKMNAPFTLSDSAARIHQPLPGRPLPVVMAHHIDWQGCGNHRIIQPFKALERHLLAEGGLINSVPGVMEAAQLQPDIILLELVTGSRFPAIIGQYREVCDAKIVLEYDDYLLNVPVKNGNRHKFPQHMIKSLRKTMESADWIVVATEPLAEAYSRFHHDIRIAKNRLAPDQWQHLCSLRDAGEKIRIGWAGGSSHAGDLEILLPLIKALEGQVEWVFMGMKPRGVKCEFHPGVPFEMYPEKLASLNLDLALVPLVDNQFNECKSNLRLLEIGTCGVPIIASNLAPYRCGLPVTLVENRFKDWMGAIQLYLNDSAWRKAQGDALREAVHRDWYLRDAGLDDWRQGWLPAGR
ncbi:glycosyltransferase [Pseudescherichia vulneris]|uniref:glycosyltransferase n=1 Tax=Pseudescherichia vulneris TaxID=566 RepID=UPI00227B45D2|nr:glycosyltransferase [Pseudescherichia vulneris]WAH52385.1 glycosyltransferase [Pseudescherichia vulneris]